MRGVVLLAIGAAAAYAAVKLRRGKSEEAGPDAETWAPPALDEPPPAEAAAATETSASSPGGAGQTDPSEANGASANGEPSGDTESTSS